MKEFDRNLMSHAKRYPHIQNEEQRLREICLENLSTEFGASIPVEVTKRLEKELTSIAACELSGVMLILHRAILQSGLKQYEVLPDGTLGASLVEVESHHIPSTGYRLPQGGDRRLEVGVRQL